MAGVAALLLSQDASRNNQFVWDKIIASADDIDVTGWDARTGYGRIDAARALSDGSTYANASGGAYLATTGITWSADQPKSSATWGYVGGAAKSTTQSVNNTNDPALYQSYREGEHAYHFDLLPGEYEVTLHFVDFFSRKTTDRVMDVLIEGQTVLSAYSIVESAGGQDTAVAETFSIDLADGELDIEFLKHGGKKSPQVNAIAIRPAAGGNSSTPAPTATPTLAATATPIITPTPVATDTPAPTATPAPTTAPTSTPENNNILINDVKAIDITNTSAVITWVTNLPASSQVEYGQRKEAKRLTSEDAELLINHAVTLSNLEPNRTYLYRAYSRSETGQLTTSVEYSFKTARK